MTIFLDFALSFVILSQVISKTTISKLERMGCSTTITHCDYVNSYLSCCRDFPSYQHSNLYVLSNFQSTNITSESKFFYMPTVSDSTISFRWLLIFEYKINIMKSKELNSKTVQKLKSKNSRHNVKIILIPYPRKIKLMEISKTASLHIPSSLWILRSCAVAVQGFTYIMKRGESQTALGYLLSVK